MGRAKVGTGMAEVVAMVRVMDKAVDTVMATVNTVDATGMAPRVILAAIPVDTQRIRIPCACCFGN